MPCMTILNIISAADLHVVVGAAAVGVTTAFGIAFAL